MSDQEAEVLAQDIIIDAICGPTRDEAGNANLAAWVGSGTAAWHAVMHLKDRASDALWFCHVDEEWQRTFLMLVACELLNGG